MSYAIMRAEKLKSHQIHFSQNHNERNHKSYSNEDINLEKTKDNYHLIESKNYSRDTEHIIQKNYKGTKTIRKDAVKNVELIFTSDKDFFDKLSHEDERKFFEKSLEFAQEYFGEKNIFSAIIHKDETTPHMHINLVPITKEGKLSAKEVVGNRKDLEQMQDKYFQKISKSFPELERGKKKEITNKIHKSLDEFKKETAENYNYKLEEKKEIQQIYQNAKGNILNSKVSIEKEDLKKIATKAIEVTKIDLVLDKYKQENKELKKENLKLTNNNRFLAPYVNKSNELRQENSMLEKEIENLKTKIISLVDKYEKEINKQKEKLNNFLTEHNFNGKSLVHYFKKFEKKERTAETKERNLLIKAQKQQQEITKKKDKERGFER
jgi:hypothetical protein